MNLFRRGAIMKMQFRSAIGGFNRSEVVQYIEYLNKQHASQVAQLNSQLQAAQNTDNNSLQQQLEEALERFRSQKLAVKTYDGRWHLTPQGFLLSNSIISDLLIIQEHCESITKRR